MLPKNQPAPKIAYLSMEIMLKTHIPTYAGGLGVLAGDLLRSCADMEIPAVGVSLVYNGNMFNQIFHPDGRQSYTPMDWRKNDQFIKLPDQISLTIDSQEVRVSCWRFDIVGYSEFIVPVFLLDTDSFENAPWKRHITEDLYSGDYYARICQEIVLGVGGIKMLQQLGFTNIEVYHMNEGHAALAPLALLPSYNYKDEEVKKHFVFTTHTPIPEGHDTFDYQFAWKYAGAYLPWHIKQLASEERLHMTELALNTSSFSFGVSRKHGEVSQAMFPNHKIGYITNGIHPRTWIGSTMQDLYNEFLPGWIEDPTKFTKAVEKIPDDKLWRAHQECKKLLIEYVNRHLTSGTSEEDRVHPDSDELFDIDTLTISLARRPVPYKRPFLIYRDLNRLVRISAGRLQIIQSGKSHPHDDISQEIVKEILAISKKLRGIVRIVYLENYSPSLARLVVSGTDLWLNTPRRFLEASGTSGMKAAINGGLNFSVQDGWWIEGYERCPLAGFSIGDVQTGLTPVNDDEADANDIYEKLKHIIMPLYYDNKKEWLNRMKYAITLGSYFNTHRCIREYIDKAWHIPLKNAPINAPVSSPQDTIRGNFSFAS